MNYEPIYFRDETEIREVLDVAAKKYDRYLIFEDINCFLIEYEKRIRKNLLEGKPVTFKGIGSLYYKTCGDRPPTGLERLKDPNVVQNEDGTYDNIPPYSRVYFYAYPKFKRELKRLTSGDPFPAGVHSPEPAAHKKKRLKELKENGEK